MSSFINHYFQKEVAKPRLGFRKPNSQQFHNPCTTGVHNGVLVELTPPNLRIRTSNLLLETLFGFPESRVPGVSGAHRTTCSTSRQVHAPVNPAGHWPTCPTGPSGCRAHRPTGPWDLLAHGARALKPRAHRTQAHGPCGP